jgi:thymidylate synthase
MGIRSEEMTLSIVKDVAVVFARDLPEAWYDCVKGIMDVGYEYLITRGSFAGQRRREFDSVVLEVSYPGSRPMIPDVPENVPPPCSMDYVERYLPYLRTGDKSQGELYTYGEDIDSQLPELIRILKEAGGGTNQACMSIGSASSLFLAHSQCLRVIDARVRYGRLHFHIYFRSWDLWVGFPANLAAIQILKEYVASEVGVKDGKLFAYSKGLHLYDHHWGVANKVLRRSK